jgi:hypothetical protein
MVSGETSVEGRVGDVRSSLGVGVVGDMQKRRDIGRTQIGRLDAGIACVGLSVWCGLVSAWGVVMSALVGTVLGAASTVENAREESMAAVDSWAELSIFTIGC